MEKKKTETLKLGDPVLVLWEDAIHDESPWAHAEEVDWKTWDNSRRHEALGFFVSARKGQLYLSGLLRPTDKKVCVSVSIPLGCVLKIQKIKRKKW